MYKPKKFWTNLKPKPTPVGTPRDKIIDRIRKLKEMSVGRGASEAEAATAARHFAALMDEHNVTLSELELKRNAAGCVNDYYMDSAPEREEWTVAFRALGPLFHVRYWISYDRHDLYDLGTEDEVTLHNFYGFPSDVEAAKALAYIVHSGIIAEAAKYLAMAGKGARRTKAIRNDLPSFHAGIGRRLHEMLLALVSTSSSTALVSLKGQLVDGEWAKFAQAHDIRLGYSRAGAMNVNAAAYAAGVKAAGNINVGRSGLSSPTARLGSS